MKIAVASTGRDESSVVSPRPGRAKFYLIFSENGRLLETLFNPFSRGGGGAGFGVAKMLADKDVDVVVGGQFGDKMAAALAQRGLAYRALEGSVREAVERFCLLPFPGA
jgi:predicted Fe-Mo cluster-binding NifX family protein